jgi:hypothetical protein
METKAIHGIAARQTDHATGLEKVRCSVKRFRFWLLSPVQLAGRHFMIRGVICLSLIDAIGLSIVFLECPLICPTDWTDFFVRR